jgi:ABC-2 type transport system permease protein
MNAYCTLTRRELSAYFFSMTGYTVIAAATFLMGLSFFVMIKNLADISTPLPITEIFFATPFFWLIVLLATPVITMRLFAQEQFTGTFETLMTTPITDAQVVLAKFTAAWLFFVVLWLPLLAMILLLRRFTSEPGAVDLASVGGAFVGLGLLGGVFMALGCLASALTRSQIIAAMLALCGGVALFLISFLGNRLDADTGLAAQVFAYFNLIDHMDDFARGVLDSRAVTLFVTLTVSFLFLTLRVVESRRWR